MSSATIMQGPQEQFFHSVWSLFFLVPKTMPDTLYSMNKSITKFSSLCHLILFILIFVSWYQCHHSYVLLLAIHLIYICLFLYFQHFLIQSEGFWSFHRELNSFTFVRITNMFIFSFSSYIIFISYYTCFYLLIYSLLYLLDFSEWDQFTFVHC